MLYVKCRIARRGIPCAHSSVWGTALIFASATSLASSAFVLPVYEIYKVGEDLHWKPGLNFFSDFGLDLVFISHWNKQ